LFTNYDLRYKEISKASKRRALHWEKRNVTQKTKPRGTQKNITVLTQRWTAVKRKKKKNRPVRCQEGGTALPGGGKG